MNIVYPGENPLGIFTFWKIKVYKMKIKCYPIIAEAIQKKHRKGVCIMAELITELLIMYLKVVGLGILLFLPLIILMWKGSK